MDQHACSPSLPQLHLYPSLEHGWEAAHFSMCVLFLQKANQGPFARILPCSHAVLTDPFPVAELTMSNQQVALVQHR